MREKRNEHQTDLMVNIINIAYIVAHEQTISIRIECTTNNSIHFPLFISHLGSLQNSFATKLQNDIKYEKFVTGFSCCLNENKMQRRETRVSLN